MYCVHHLKYAVQWHLVYTYKQHTQRQIESNLVTARVWYGKIKGMAAQWVLVSTTITIQLWIMFRYLLEKPNTHCKSLSLFSSQIPQQLLINFLSILICLFGYFLEIESQNMCAFFFFDSFTQDVQYVDTLSLFLVADMFCCVSAPHCAHQFINGHTFGLFPPFGSQLFGDRYWEQSFF